MAVDKLVDSSQLDADLTSVANAIRTKGGTSASLAFPADFVSAIAAIPSGGGSTSEVVINLTADMWEVGAVQGQTGGTYEQRKTSNAARLRGIDLFATNNIPFTLCADWNNGTYQLQYACYSSDGKGTSNFTVISADTEIPATPYLAVVARYTNGTTQMSTSDINTIKPRFKLDLSAIGIVLGGQ